MKEPRYPMLLNTNLEVQDQDGWVYAKVVDREYGEKLVELLNEGDVVGDLDKPVELVNGGKRKGNPGWEFKEGRWRKKRF